MITHDIRSFTWKGNKGVCDLSDLGRVGYGDIGGGKKGFTVKGVGKDIVFELKRVKRDRENEIEYYEFTGGPYVIYAYND